MYEIALLTAHGKRYIGQTSSTPDAAWDKFHLAKIQADQSQYLGVVLEREIPGEGEGVELRRHLFPVAQLPALKLSDAMKKALASANSETGVLSAGQARTLKALEDRGLVAISKTGAAKLTTQGRQYSRV